MNLSDFLYLGMFFRKCILVLTVIILLNACCEVCDIRFSDEQLDWLPYSYDQQVSFRGSESEERILFVGERTVFESQEKDCERLNEKICYMKAAQLLKTDKTIFGSNYLIEISKFKDNAILLSIHFVTGSNSYEYIGTTISSYNIEEEMIPNIDSLVVSDKTFYQVYKIDGINDPLTSGDSTRVSEFYFTRKDGLIQFNTMDNKVWMLEE